MRLIPYGRQDIDESDISAVVAALKSDWLTQGPLVGEFENAVAEYCAAPYACAVNSATSALHIACLAMGLGPGDRLWTTPNTFVASANCARYCGAQVSFVDIEERTSNMSVEALRQKLQEASRTGTLPKIIIPVHFGGLPCDMRGIAELARSYGPGIIEDASHAIGAEYEGTRVGSCSYSDVAVFSFHPVKIMTTAEGGMALTRNAELANRMTRLRTHGITRDAERMSKPPEGAWYYEQIDLGFNYRMTDVQAALGKSQLKRVEKFLARRRALARQYDDALRGLPLILPVEEANARSAWHLYVVRLDHRRCKRSRQDVFAAMRSGGIGVNVHYIPVHTQPYYRAQGFDWGMYPKAEAYYRDALSLPLYFGLTDDDQRRVVETLTRVVA